jgi:hypothetical protein
MIQRGYARIEITSGHSFATLYFHGMCYTQPTIVNMMVTTDNVNMVDLLFRLRMCGQ